MNEETGDRCGRHAPPFLLRIWGRGSTKNLDGQVNIEL
jgi:hypothetical protein